MRIPFTVTIVSAAVLIALAGCTSHDTTAQATSAQSSRTGSPASGQRPASSPGGAVGGGFSGPGGFAGRSGSSQQAAFGHGFAAVQVQSETVQSIPLVTDNVSAGTVVPVTQSQVAAQSSGIVEQILHNAGEMVDSGEAVIQLNDTVLTIAVQNAQASLDNARINLQVGQETATASNPRLSDQLNAAQGAYAAAQKNYEAQKAQYDVGGISGAQLDNAKSALDSASANVSAAQAALDQNTQSDSRNIAQLKIAVTQATNQLQLAQINLEHATIRAPFAGQIASINVSLGSFVGTNAAAFLLVSSAKQIDFTEPPTDAPAFKVGDTVSFSYGGRSYPVKILQSPSAPINGVVPMVASIPAGLSVPYGSVGTISYKTALATGPQISVSSLLSSNGANYVYTIVSGKAKEEPVAILAEAGEIAVVQGVKAGDEIILNPPPGLLDGADVQVVAAGASGGAHR